jgi:deoxycytidylate deaminase
VSQTVITLRTPRSEATSQHILSGEIAHELVFAVVGHVGSGTTETAKLLKAALEAGELPGGPYEVTHLKAREEILAWAEQHGKPLPKHEPAKIDYVISLQDLGDQMREAGDHAAVACAMARRVRRVRATKQGKPDLADGEAVIPDGKRRAYILDSIRHPTEVQLLRNVYQAAFTLVGVVCDEETRIDRLTKKFSNAGRGAALDLMKRDSDAPQKHGQRVADAFHMADVFLDNSAPMFRDAKKTMPNPAWDIPDQLARVVRIILHSQIVRPRPEETAMHAAYGAQLRSACLSRQVGAALIDAQGNVVATGTNDVPRAGGGLYQDTPTHAEDHRCAFRHVGGDPYCSNTREQKEIIREAIDQLIAIGALRADQVGAVSEELQRTRIGALLEFSRAVHAEMDALLSAARTGTSTINTRLFVTTFPCHYCARHLVAAGIEEVQYIEPYPKSQALKLHDDSISVDVSDWKPFSEGGTRVLFRPFRGIAPRMYARAFLKDRELKDKVTGKLRIAAPEWGSTWDIGRVSYVELEAKLSKEGE